MPSVLSFPQMQVNFAEDVSHEDLQNVILLVKGQHHYSHSFFLTSMTPLLNRVEQ